MSRFVRNMAVLRFLIKNNFKSNTTKWMHSVRLLSLNVLILRILCVFFIEKCLFFLNFLCKLEERKGGETSDFIY